MIEFTTFRFWRTAGTSTGAEDPSYPPLTSLQPGTASTGGMSFLLQPRPYFSVFRRVKPRHVMVIVGQNNMDVRDSSEMSFEVERFWLYEDFQ